MPSANKINTYAAQSSLMPQDPFQEVNHPLVPQLFTGHENGRYVKRNEPAE